MSFVDDEKHDAALELCGVVSSLVINEHVPDFMQDYLMARVTRVRRAFGISDAVTPAKQARSA